MIKIFAFILIYIVYFVYKTIKYKTYISGLETLQVELYSRALRENIDLNSNDYKNSYIKIETLIKTAKKSTIIDFLYFRFVVFPRDKKEILKQAKKIEKELEIKNKKMKKIDNEIYQKALILSLKHMYLGSFIGWIYTVIIAILITLKLPNIIVKKDNITFDKKLKDITKTSEFMELKICR